MGAERIIRWMMRIGLVTVILFSGGLSGVGAPVSVSSVSRATSSFRAAVRRTEMWTDLSTGEGEFEDRIQIWRDRGVQFKGTWQPEEMALTLDILDAFAEMVGEDRFSILIEEAVRAGSFEFKRHLTVVRKQSWGLPAAVWYALPGQVVLNDSLFDAQFVYENYSWSFLQGPYVDLSREIAMQEAIIGHEVGHVLIDGLHAEARSNGDRDLSLETLYDQMVPSEQWPHAGYVANENLATESAVWALEIGRTAEVDAFRTRLALQFDAGLASLP